MKAQNFLQLTSVQAGGAICLPMFLIGHTLEKKVGLPSSLIALFLGNFLLFVIALVTAYFGAKYRQSTAEIIRSLFGKRGAILFSVGMSLSLLGWFSIQLNVMTMGLQELLIIPKGFEIYINLMLGLIIALVALKGSKGMCALANISMPILVAMIALAVSQALGNDIVETESLPITLGGLSLVLASAIGAVIDLPTFFRESRSQKDALIATALLFLFVIPLIEGVGIYLSVKTGDGNIIAALTGNSSSPLLKAFAALFVLFAGWTTNQANLYSATVSSQVIFPKISPLMFGLFATGLSCFNVLDQLTELLEVIGIVLASMGGIMIAALLKGQKGLSPVTLFLSLAAGFFSPISGIGVVDAFLAAGIIQYIINYGVSYDYTTNA